MKVLVENYKAKCPLDSLARVSLCEESVEIYDSETKTDLRIQKLFLITDKGVRFSNSTIEDENRSRINQARKQKMKYYEKLARNNRPSE